MWVHFLYIRLMHHLVIESGIKPLITPAIPSDATDIGAGSGPGPKTGRNPEASGSQSENVPDTDKNSDKNAVNERITPGMMFKCLLNKLHNSI